MKLKRRCKNCGAVIDMSIERHYIARTADGGGVFTRYTLLDAFDCQDCGCQYISGVRAPKEDSKNLMKINENKEEHENGMAV